MESVDEYAIEDSSDSAKIPETAKLPDDFEPEPEPSPDDPEPEQAGGSDKLGEFYEEKEQAKSSVNKVDDDMKASLESDDPWLQRKQRETM